MNPYLYDVASSGKVGFQIGGDVLNQKTPKDNNILHIAAEFKQIKLFEVLGVDHDQSPLFWASNKKGNTPLHIAARVGCNEVVKFLINHAKRTPHVEGDDDEESRLVDGEEAHKRLLRKTNSEDDTALHVAARCGHDGVVSLLMQADPELCCLTNSGKESPLFVAIRQGFLSIAHYILNNCPTPICPSFEGINDVTALHLVVTHTDNDKVSKGIVKNLKIVAEVKYPVTMKMVDACGCWWTPPLHYVALDIVKIMVRKYPETIKRVDALGWTPLHYAALSGNLEATQILLNGEATQILLNGDTSASYILDNKGMSALHVAAYVGHIKVIEEITQRMPDACDLLNDKGQTVLHAAVLGGRRKVVKYILKTPKLAGLINEADDDGNTPLHLAAIYKNPKILGVLAGDKRVNTNAINKKFLKAIDIFLGDNIEELEIKSGSSTTLKQLGRAVGLPFFHEQIKQGFWESKSPPEKDTDENKDTNTNEDKRGKEERRESRLLIATIIATVTFAAAFTVPGGIDNKGKPILQGSDHYKVFLYSNQIAFAAVAFVMYNEIVEKQFLSPRRVEILIRISVGGMALAFTAGINAVRKAQKKMDNGEKMDFDYYMKKYTRWLFEKTFWVYVILIVLTLALPRAYSMSKVALKRLKPRAYIMSNVALRRLKFRKR